MPFPFLRLPEGIQITILKLALSEWQIDVCDLLVTCWHIHRLCIPILYNSITWRDSFLSESLLLVFEAHPEYAEYVRHLEIDLYFYRQDNRTQSSGSNIFGPHEVDFAVQFVRRLQKAIRRSANPNRKLDKLKISFPQDRIADVAEILQRLQPKHLIWLETEPVEYRLVPGSFGAVMMKYSGMHEWFPRVRRLNVQGSVLDAATAHLFGHLPNVEYLAVGLAPRDPTSTRNLACILLSTSRLKSLKSLRLKCQDYCQRRQVQLELGVCLGQGDFCHKEEKLVCGCGQPDYRHFVRGHGSHDLRINGLTTTCPRCCVTARMATATAGIVQRVYPPRAFEVHFKSQSRHYHSKLLDGLCPMHYNEIYVQDHACNPLEWAASLLRRRVLECMVWV